MDSAMTDQAESMYKTLESMRQSLDKYDDVDVENITIDGRIYNINETIESWIRKIYVSKDKNKKKEKKEERIKTDKNKRLLQMSNSFPTKMEDEASVLGFLCHMIRMQPLLPSDEDADSLDEPALVANVKANIIRYEDVKATSKYETLSGIISY